MTQLPKPTFFERIKLLFNQLKYSVVEYKSPSQSGETKPTLSDLPTNIPRSDKQVVIFSSWLFAQRELYRMSSLLLQDYRETKPTLSDSSTTRLTDNSEEETVQEDFFSSLKSFSTLIWIVVVIVVIIPLLGKAIIAFSFSATPPKQIEKTQIVTTIPVDWDKLIQSTLQSANQKAYNYAEEELDLWVAEMTTKIDDSFLDWYFGYFNQKKIEYKGFSEAIISEISTIFDKNGTSPNKKVAEAITKDFQKEFTKRVFRPEIAQLRLERITNQTIRYYLDQLNTIIGEVPTNYQIPEVEWERYLKSIAVTIYDTEGDISNSSLKVFTGGGAYLLAKPFLAPIVAKVGSQVVAKIAGKAGAKIATKTGGAVVGKMGSVLLDGTVGVGIILWDIWDNNHNAAIEKPILRENLVAYLKELKYFLLRDPETGIMVPIDKIEETIRKATFAK